MNAQTQQTSNQPTEEVPWLLKYGVRFVAIVASIVSLILGLMNCLMSVLSPMCLLSGIIQMIVAVLVLLVEAPCLCPFLDFAQLPGNMMDRRPYWIRAVVYIILSLIPLFFCLGINIFFGCGLVFVSGTLYGALALGKKAPMDQMKTRTTSMFNLINPGSKNPGDVEAGVAAH